MVTSDTRFDIITQPFSEPAAQLDTRCHIYYLEDDTTRSFIIPYTSRVFCMI